MPLLMLLLSISRIVWNCIYRWHSGMDEVRERLLVRLAPLFVDLVRKEEVLPLEFWGLVLQRQRGT